MFMFFFSLLALAAFVRAGFEAIEVETLHVIEYTEVCKCPTTPTVLPVNPITTLVCCDTCAPVTVTATTQPITSCTTQFTKTTAFCETTGVYLLGETLYPCNAPPCEIEYQAPCPTCYVCPYSECWVPNSNPRHVKVYEYFGNYNREVDCWEENWTPTTWHETFVKTTHFPGPTIFIENNIQINITAAMDYTYTQTSTLTSTATATVTETTSIPASSAGGGGPTPSPTDIKFVLKSGSHAGHPVLILDGKLAFGNTTDHVQTLQLEGNEIFDLEGHIAYISTSDLSSQNKSFLNFVNLDSVPLDGRTSIFTLDDQGNLIVVVDNVTLIAIICDGDFISFGYSAGTCEIVQLAPQGSVPTVSSGTPLSSAPASSSVLNLTSIPAISSRSPSNRPHSESPSSQPPSSYPFQSYPSSTYASSSPPSSSPAPSSAPSNEPSAPPSSTPASEPVSSAPPAPTFSLLVATVSNTNLDQGNGTSLTDTSTVDLTSYDQFNAALAGVNFTLECNQPSDLCVFRLDPQGAPVNSLTMDTNGNAEFYFNSIKAGSKCIRIYNEAHVQVKAFPVSVQPVVDCNAGTVAITNVTDPSNLLIGLDQPVLQSSVFDLIGDPISGQPVSFQPTFSPGRSVKKRVINSILTNSNGIAEFPAPPSLSNAVQEWSSTPANCPAKLFQTLNWQFGVNCDASVIVPSQISLYKDQLLTINGVYSPMPGCVLDNASVYVEAFGNPPVTIPLVNGVFTYTVGFTSMMIPGPQTQLIVLTFLGSSTPCVKQWPIVWMDRPPACNGQSTMAVSPFNPVATPEVMVTIVARDEFGNALPNTFITVTSVTRDATLSAYSWSGMSDNNGLFTAIYTNNDFGNGNDVFRATLTRGDGTCSMSSVVNWQLP